jgi:prepilin-type N-terminal cleavage/methylation domain-containing protein
MQRRAFTLIELIIVVAIIAILLAATFMLLDPVRRLNQARNTARRADAAAIAGAVSQAITSEDTSPRVDIPDRKWRMIGTATTGCDVFCGDVGHTTAALRFKDKNSFIALSKADYNFDYNTPFSISAWVNPTIEGGPVLSSISPTGAPLGGYTLFTNDHNVLFGVIPVRRGTLSEGVVAANAVTPGTYAFITATYNGSVNNPTFSIYVDGVLKASQSYPPVGSGQSFTSVVDPHIGGELWISLGDQYFFGAIHISLTGIVDDVRVYRGVLEATDIARIMEGGEHQSPSVDLIGHWMFDENLGRDTEDASDHFNTGIMHGDPEWIIDDASLPHVVVDGVRQPIRYALPDRCIDLNDDLVATGKLPRPIVNRPTDEVTPDETRTYYAVRNVNGLISVRSCLSEGEGRLGAGDGPAIEASR